jgi:predicted DNA-binding protein (UPF0251 family)
MPRPRKWRRVAFEPVSTYFKPAGIPLRQLEEVVLTMEEVEALRLKEVEGVEPEECAQAMCISRPTFHRVLSSARRKVAEAIVLSKALHIAGGDFLPAVQPFHCLHDGHRWDVPFQQMAATRDLVCPACRSAEVEPVPPFGPAAMGRWRHSGRHGRRQHTPTSRDPNHAI